MTEATKPDTPTRVASTEELGPASHARIATKAAKAKQMRDAGMTFRAIGAQLGVCAQRARQLVTDGRRLEVWRATYPRAPADSLSPRLRNCLTAEVYYQGSDTLTPALVRRWINSGHIRTIPNLGAKGVQDIEVWLEGLGA